MVWISGCISAPLHAAFYAAYAAQLWWMLRRVGRFGLVIASVTICGAAADAGLTYTAIKLISQYADTNPDFPCANVTGAVSPL